MGLEFGVGERVIDFAGDAAGDWLDEEGDGACADACMESVMKKCMLAIGKPTRGYEGDHEGGEEGSFGVVHQKLPFVSHKISHVNREKVHTLYLIHSSVSPPSIPSIPSFHFFGIKCLPKCSHT